VIFAVYYNLLIGYIMQQAISVSYFITQITTPTLKDNVCHEGNLSVHTTTHK